MWPVVGNDLQVLGNGPDRSGQLVMKVVLLRRHRPGRRYSYLCLCMASDTPQRKICLTPYRGRGGGNLNSNGQNNCRYGLWPWDGKGASREQGANFFRGYLQRLSTSSTAFCS